jgi:4-hydroxy-tetrahydrodipicolinate reductase
VIRVGVVGAAGRMGREACRAIVADDELELAAAVDPSHAGLIVEGTTVVGSLDELAGTRAEVVVEFTRPGAALANIAWCVAHGLHVVTGTTGFEPDPAWAEQRAVGVFVAPNFAIGAVLMMRFAALAAPWFDTGEIIELHHDNKIDAPSGTAMATARRMTEASEEWGTDPTTTVVADGARGGLVGDAIRVHSVRMRGVIASQEVLLGTTGQTLAIRHDTFDRSSFMPGVLLGVRRVAGLPDGLTLGLDPLLDQ